jgi:hypothetical protein
VHARRIPQQSIFPAILLLDSARFRGPGCGGDLPATSDPFKAIDATSVVLGWQNGCIITR